MKRGKSTGGYRGGRSRPPVRYYIFPEDMTLVHWDDGVYEWIRAEQNLLVFNRITQWNVRGRNGFSTRRAAERAIRSFRVGVDLEKRYRGRYKMWRYPAVAGRPRPIAPTHPRGTIVRFRSSVSLYSREAENYHHRTLGRVEEGALGVVVDIEETGITSQVIVGGVTGWVETRYLVPLEG